MTPATTCWRVHVSRSSRKARPLFQINTRGEAQALNRERTADNIDQVLTAEGITSLPNTNIADAVGRLPSVSLERDEGVEEKLQKPIG
jgi:hypothetical protein